MMKNEKKNNFSMYHVLGKFKIKIAFVRLQGLKNC